MRLPPASAKLQEFTVLAKGFRLAADNKLSKEHLLRHVCPRDFLFVSHGCVTASAAEYLTAGSTSNKLRTSARPSGGTAFQQAPRKRELPMRTGSRCMDLRIRASDVLNGSWPDNRWKKHYANTPQVTHVTISAIENLWSGVQERACHSVLCRLARSGLAEAKV